MNVNDIAVVYLEFLHCYFFHSMCVLSPPLTVLLYLYRVILGESVECF